MRKAVMTEPVRGISVRGLSSAGIKKTAYIQPAIANQYSCHMVLCFGAKAPERVKTRGR